MSSARWATALVAVAFLGAGGGPALGKAAPTAVVSLSGPGEASRWANPAQRALIRRGPSVRGKVLARLRLQNEDGLPEVYALIRRRTGPDGDWVEIRVPGRQRQRTGWVPRDALGDFRRTTTTVTVDRRTLYATVRKAGRTIARFRVGVGKRGTATPAGRFYIRVKFKVSGQGVYGPRALGTSAYAPRLTDWPGGGVIGFHGTNQPGLVPGRPSHGCIRMRNRDILRFYRLVGVGTPVRIL